MKTGRVILGAVVVLAASLALAAAATADHKRVTKAAVARSGLSLTEMDYNTVDPGSSVVTKLLNTCAAKVGVTIHRHPVPGEQLLPKTLQAAASHSLPDLLLLDNPDVPAVAQTGALVPLSKFGVKPQGYLKGTLAAGKYKGAQYGVAPAMNTLALFYNKDLFAQAHLTPPTTWSELLRDAKALTSPPRYGIALSGSPNEGTTFDFEPFFWSNGADLRKLNSPKAVAALQLWVNLLNQGGMSRSAINWNLGDVGNQFVAGNAAMMVSGPWMFNQLNAAKDLHWGIVPVPVPRKGMKAVVPLGGEMWTVPSTHWSHESAAGRVVQCLSQSSMALQWAKLNAYVPSNPAVAKQAVKLIPNLASFAAELPTARGRTSTLGSGYPKVSQALWTAVQTALTGAKSAQAALDDAQAAAKG